MKTTSSASAIAACSPARPSFEEILSIALDSQTDGFLAIIDAHIADCDPYLYLAQVQLRLADKVMDAGDVQAWWLIDSIKDSMLPGRRI